MGRNYLSNLKLQYGTTIEVWEWMSNFVPHFIRNKVTYPCSHWIAIQASRCEWTELFKWRTRASRCAPATRTGRDSRHSLQWRHNGRGGVSNHQPHDCLLNRWFRRRSKKTSKFRVTGLSVGISPGTGEFPAQMASNAENVFIWWRHHDRCFCRRIFHGKQGEFAYQIPRFS